MVEDILSQISRSFLKAHNVYRYGMKKVDEMNDHDVIKCCHFYCEDHNLTREYNEYFQKAMVGYFYCPCFKGYISETLCYDLQMIKEGFIERSVLADEEVNASDLKIHCPSCKHLL